MIEPAPRRRSPTPASHRVRDVLRRAGLLERRMIVFRVRFDPDNGDEALRRLVLMQHPPEGTGSLRRQADSRGSP